MDAYVMVCVIVIAVCVDSTGEINKNRKELLSNICMRELSFDKKPYELDKFQLAQLLAVMDYKYGILEDESKCVVFYVALQNRMDEIERYVLLQFPWLLDDVKDRVKRWQIIIFFVKDYRIRIIVRRLLDNEVDPSVFFSTVQAVYKLEHKFVYEKTQLDIFTEEELDHIMNKLKVSDPQRRAVIKTFALPFDKKTEDLLKQKPITDSDLDKFEGFTSKNPRLKMTNLPDNVGTEKVSKKTIAKFLEPGIPKSIELCGDYAVATFSNVRKLVQSFYYMETRYIGNNRVELNIEFENEDLA